jgi:hypothetical protein
LHVKLEAQEAIRPGPKGVSRIDEYISSLSQICDVLNLQ